jgi:hypothetical protein
MSFKQVHMAALAAALLAGTAGFAYAQSSTPSTAPTKPGVSSQTGPAHGATTGAASEEMKKGDTAKDAPKADATKAESAKGDAAKTESKGEASKTEKEGKTSETMGGKTNAKAETSPDGATAKAADGKADTMNKADTTGKGANDSAASPSSAKAGGNINLTTQQKTVIKKTVIDNKSAPRVTSVNFQINVGTVVPTTVRYAPLPTSIIEIHPAWRGYDYFVYEDQVIIIEPRSHKIVEIIVVS